MGVCLLSYAVRDETIAAVCADPPLVWRVLEADDESAYLNAIGFGARPSIWARLLGRKPPTPVVRRLSFTEPELQMLDLDKAWDGLNTCLKAVDPAVPNFFESSDPIGAIDVGYGPALYHRSEVMQRIARAWLALSAEGLLEAFQRQDMTQCYLGDFWTRQPAEARAYLSEHFAELQAFLRHTAEHRLGAVLQFT